MFINNDLNLTTTHAKHFGISGNSKAGNTDPMPKFAEALNSAFEKVNNLETNAEALQQQMVTNPDSVNLHEVTVAQAEAEMALSFTKSISSRVITSFNELTNLR